MLTKVVLASLPLHIISVTQPPKACILQMEKSTANFLWGESEGKNKHHWIAWRKLCFPTKEEGVGLRTIQGFCNAFSSKN